MRLTTPIKIVLALLGLAVLSLLAYQLPPIQSRLGWRVDFALTYLRGMASPAGAMPTTLPQPRVAVTRQPTPTLTLDVTPGPSPTPTPGITPTPTPSPTPLPPSAILPSPKWEKQDINNCGPTTLAFYLRYYGWEGDQQTIAGEIKPIREDRNVNVEEIDYYVRNFAGWLSVQYRVAGNIDLLKRLVASGFPVMIEESFYFPESYWPNDDHWAAHYFLVTGYDDAEGIMIGQDSYYGADQKVKYEELDEYWQSFNRVYILLYPPEREPEIKEILGEDWDPDVNRQNALEIAEAETKSDPENAFAWFNLGTNHMYFERYFDATDAYDKARNLGLPQRMLRYQFGPFIAYFHSGQMDDLTALTDYALQRTKNSEEALLWKGWGLYREGKNGEALYHFQQALAARPGYADAQYALEFVGSNP